MKKQETYRDQQLAQLLQDSFVARPEAEVDRFARRVMQRLPRRRRTVLTLLLAYIQSPLWLVTAVVLCLTVCALSIDDIMERFANPQSLALLVILLTAGIVLLFLDMLRDVERMTTT